MTGTLLYVLGYVNVTVNLQMMCTSLSDRHQRKTVFVVDVSINWATNGNGQTKVLDTWKVTQLNVPRQQSVDVPATCTGKLRDGPADRTVRPTEIETADQSRYITQSQCTDTGPTSLSTNPITPGAAPGRVATRVLASTSLVWSDWEKAPWGKVGFDVGSAALEADASPPGHQAAADKAPDNITVSALGEKCRTEQHHSIGTRRKMPHRTSQYRH